MIYAKNLDFLIKFNELFRQKLELFIEIMQPRRDFHVPLQGDVTIEEDILGWLLLNGYPLYAIRTYIPSLSIWRCYDVGKRIVDREKLSRLILVNDGICICPVCGYEEQDEGLMHEHLLTHIKIFTR
jgi:hypothetical protein